MKEINKSLNQGPIRILNVVPNMRAAGIESFIMNVYRNIDRSKVQFDFLVHSNKEEFFDGEIKELGGRIYRFSYKDDKNIIKYIKDLNSFFKEHKEYHIIHGHMQSMMPLYLYIAKKNKIPVRIAHSHNSNYEKSLKGIILHIFSRLAKYTSTLNIACSDVAGKYLFGNRKYEIIYNGVDIKKFEFNEKVRKEMRSKLNVENKYVIGHIGRFELQKNHEYLINIVKELKNENIVLWLIGEGKLENKIKKMVSEKGLEGKIQFLGVRNDVNKLYQAMDCFVLPSLYEGLPVVGVEAQISGLNCLFSDNITKEVKILENTKYIKINNDNIEDWAEEIKRRILNKNNIRECKDSYYKKFDIKNISENLMSKYLTYEKLGE